MEWYIDYTSIVKVICRNNFMVTQVVLVQKITEMQDLTVTKYVTCRSF